MVVLLARYSEGRNALPCYTVKVVKAFLSIRNRNITECIIPPHCGCPVMFGNIGGGGGRANTYAELDKALFLFSFLNLFSERGSLVAQARKWGLSGKSS